MLAALFCFAIVAFAGDLNRAGQMVTADLAQKILGGPVEPGSLNSNGDTEIGKTWVSRVSFAAKAGGSSAISFTVLIRHGDSPEQAKQIFESSKATFKGVDVGGLGDAAYRTQMPGQLDVLKGMNWLIISAGTFKTPDPALQEKVAHEVLPKIPNP